MQTPFFILPGISEINKVLFCLAVSCSKTDVPVPIAEAPSTFSLKSFDYDIDFTGIDFGTYGLAGQIDQSVSQTILYTTKDGLEHIIINPAYIKTTPPLHFIRKNESWLFENKYIEDRETAKLYVEGLNTYFGQPMGNWNDLNVFCESLHNKLGNVEVKINELYESLDILSERDSLSNIEKKVIAKKKLVEHLTTKKKITESKDTTLVPNESLLNAVLTNNFNVLYSNTLSESEKEELKNILSISYDDLIIKSNELHESILEKVSTLISESNDIDLTTKLNKVKDEVNQMTTSKYNYYRLTELKNGLN